MSRQTWQTLPSIFKLIDDLVGPLTLDAAASDDWHLCDRYLTEREDALKLEDWGDCNAFLNPPFAGMESWAERAIAHVRRYPNRRVALLCLASVNADWFHDAWREGLLLIPDRRINYWHPEERPRSFNRDSVVFIIGAESKGEATAIHVHPHMAELRELHRYIHEAA